MTTQNKTTSAPREAGEFGNIKGGADAPHVGFNTDGSPITAAQFAQRHHANEAGRKRWENLANEAISDVLYWKHETRQAQTENARLREVNAELLAALKQFSTCDLTPINCASIELASKRVRNIARAAIVKAEGRAQ